MKKISRLSAILLLICFLSGCSYVLFKREKDKTDPTDEGSVTKIQLKGPKAAIHHKF